jgi:hypothetical protein
MVDQDFFLRPPGGDRPTPLRHSHFIPFTRSLTGGSDLQTVSGGAVFSVAWRGNFDRLTAQKPYQDTQFRQLQTITPHRFALIAPIRHLLFTYSLISLVIALTSTIHDRSRAREEIP